jgi:hypothetical protein
LVVYSLEGSNGDTVTFGDSEYVLKIGINGFGIPPTSVRIEESAGDGGVWRHTKRQPRDLALPITVFGTDRYDVQTKLRRLGRILQDGQGAPRFRATYDDASSVFLDLHYTGGGETLYDNNSSGLTWASWGITLRAPNPFWKSGLEETFTIGSGNIGRGLLPQFTKLKLSSSTTIGVVTVVNAGDVATYPVWEIVGPVSSLEISRAGFAFGFSSLAPGEIIIVNTETGTVTNVDGQNLYARLNPAPKLFSLPPGTTGVTVSGTDTTEEFNATLTYSPRYEVIH